MYNVIIVQYKIVSEYYSVHFIAGPMLATVGIFQQSVGVLATALMKTGSDISSSTTSLLSHHAQTFLQFLPH